MEISFANERLQDLCESRKELQRKYGQQCAKKLMRRLLDLEAATCLGDMRNLPGRCHELTGDRGGELAVDLADGKRLVLSPSNDSAPTKDDGGLDWDQVDAICVSEIVDYHG